MRKLWPPTYDDFSIRIWAAIVSLIFNFVLWVLSFAGSQTALWSLLFPGMFPAAMLGCDFEDTCTRSGAVAWVLTELVFYYFIAWMLIRAFRPSTNWWPEKRT